MEYDKDDRRSSAVHFDTKTTLWVVFSALAMAGGLFVWGMNMQERVGVVETEQGAMQERALLRHNSLVQRIQSRANMTDREVSRIEGRFDKLDETLVRIEDKLDKKADRGEG